MTKHDKDPPVSFLTTLRELHVDDILHWCLQIGHDKADLAKGPTEYDTKYDHYPYGKPHDKCRSQSSSFQKLASLMKV